MLIEWEKTNSGKWKVKDKIIKPIDNMTGHTGFLVFADILI